MSATIDISAAPPAPAPRALQPFVPFDTKGYRERASRVPGIEVVYAFDSGAEGSCPKAVPDGCADVVFGIGPRDVEVLVGGTVLAASDWRFDANRTWVGCRFAPGAALLPAGLAPQDIVGCDLRLPGDAYGGALADGLARPAGAAARMALLESALAGRVGAKRVRAGAGAAALERYVRRRIYATDGAISVSMLARECGVSERYLRRVFTRVHGISPKQFSCFVRFQRLLGLIAGEGTGGAEAGCVPGGADADADGVSVRDMALACGYFDQAHLVHEFKRFTGSTPERYRAFMKTRAQG